MTLDYDLHLDVQFCSSVSGNKEKNLFKLYSKCPFSGKFATHRYPFLYSIAQLVERRTEEAKFGILRSLVRIQLNEGFFFPSHFTYINS